MFKGATMPVPSGPKGTRDFYPEEMAFQQFIFSKWQKTCERYGFESYDAPMFENLEIYTQKSGDEIEHQLYTFEDKGGRKMALRPELTPSLARMVAAKGSALKRPIRWYSIPRLFRYERMQKGRLREFYQLNMDILGVETIDADAELIAAVIGMMTDLGFVATDFKVRISSRTLLEELFTSAGMSKDSFGGLYALLDKKNKISVDEYTHEMELVIADYSVREKIAALFNASSLEEVISFAGKTPAAEELLQLFDLLRHYGLSEYVVFDIGIVRGLAYYTGIVFEVFDIKKNMRAIAGGGRYDKLVELYGGLSTPAVGFAAGDVVLGDLLKEKGLTPPLPPRSKVFIVSFEDVQKPEVISLAQEIRSIGISCEFSLKEGAVGKQLKNANAARCLYTVFMGGDEGVSGNVRVKNMATGSEELVKSTEVATFLSKIL
jgi:histidyl-tRNA synthetase